MLTAVVRAGLSPRTCDLIVTNPDGQSYTFADAFEIVAPTPTRTRQPTSTPVPTNTPIPTSTPFKRPLLFISSYSTDPASVGPEESVVVTLNIKNVGDTSADKIRVSFVSDLFVPKGTSGTQAISKLKVDSSATVNQRLTLAKEATTGLYQQQVIMEYEDPNGVSYRSAEVVGIAVTAPEYGQPRVIIHEARTIPDPIIPGQPFSLTLILRNVGDGMAEDVLVGIGGSGPAVPLTAGSRQLVAMLAAEGMQEVSQSLTVSEATQKGSHNQAISVQYRDERGNFYDAEQWVGLTVQGLEKEERTSWPRLTIASYSSQPESLIPGEVFNLFVDLANIGQAPAKDIRLVLGSGELTEDMSGGYAAPAMAPFAPLDTSNVKFIPYVGAQERTTVVQRMIVDGNARSGIYALRITFGYQDEEQVKYTAGELITLLVVRQPHLQIEPHYPITEAIAGAVFPIRVEIINIGPEAANVGTAELRSLDLEIQDRATYIGPLDPGAAGLLEVQALTYNSGEAIAQVIIRYLDDFGHQQQVIEELRFQVAPASTAAPTPVQPTATPVPTPQLQERLSFGNKIVGLVKALLGLGVG